MTFAAGLSVVEGPQAIGGDVLDFLKELLVGLAASGIGKSVAQIVEAGGGVGGRLGVGENRQAEHKSAHN